AAGAETSNTRRQATQRNRSDRKPHRRARAVLQEYHSRYRPREPAGCGSPPYTAPPSLFHGELCTMGRPELFRDGPLSRREGIAGSQIRSKTEWSVVRDRSRQGQVLRPSGSLGAQLDALSCAAVAPRLAGQAEPEP